jgi:hypothetical protein
VVLMVLGLLLLIVFQRRNRNRGEEMQRRNVIAGLPAPRRSSAQQSQGKIPRVGIVTVEQSERAPKFDAFRAGLRDLGYIEGRNIILEFRFARGDLSRGRN